MMSDEQKVAVKEELFELCEKMLSEELNGEQLKRLEELVVTDGRMRKLYVEYMHQHAGLYWQHAGESEALALNSLIAGLEEENGGGHLQGRLGDDADIERAKGKLVIGPWAWRKMAAAAAVLVGGVLLGWGFAEKKSSQPIVATLVKSANCAWQGGVLPTEEGAQLQAGRLRLQQGLARLKFASGVELTLEAPVDIELISPMLCRLYRGTVVAKVPEPAQGFTVETDNAKLVDHGTEFGVHVGEQGGQTNVVVFDGIVDVEQKNSGKVQRLITGNGSRVSGEMFETMERAPLELVGGDGRILVEDTSAVGKQVVITTADGRGEDVYVQATDSDIHTSEQLLLVKNSEVFDAGIGYTRKVYLRFDLDALLSSGDLLRAQLKLAVEPSNFGYASFVPDAEFVVYGVRDDLWQRDQITWQNAPANNHTGGSADLDEAIELGSFFIPQGVYSGEVGVEGDALVNFLRQENNNDGLATFLVVRRTGEIRRGSGLVHAFASKRHPSAAPPTLKLRLAE
ncbi:MAG: DNRLRE domain-containing protein [Verrucomicrobiota bacterium]